VAFGVRNPSLSFGAAARSAAARRAVEALFIAPGWLRRGGGRRLLLHARELAGPLTVVVNGQNSDALAFYLAQGIEIMRRSPVDSAGRPYPLLYLKESHTAFAAG
jgi:putative acetyltransferase